MSDPLINDIAKLHQKIHADDPEPADEQERQAAYIFANTQRIIMELVAKDVRLRTLELGLLYNWLRLATLIRGYDEDQATQVSGHLEVVVQRLMDELRALDADLEDEEPNPDMAQLGGKIAQLRNLFGNLHQTDLPHHEVERQTDLTTRALFSFTGACLDQEMHPGLLESTMLYYWLRSFAMSAQMPEAVFQKLERQWPVVVQRVGTMTDEMLRELAQKPASRSEQKSSNGLTEKHIQLARQIDAHVRHVLANGGGDEELLLSMYHYMGTFKQLLDASSEADVEQLCQQYDGFYRFAKLLERVAEGIADGSIPVPKTPFH